MKLFFEVCKEFFDLLYLPFVSDIIENEIIGEKLDELNHGFDEEKGYQVEEDNLVIQYDGEEHDDEVVCECDFLRQILSVINARIYKFINDNKSE